MQANHAICLSQVCLMPSLVYKRIQNIAIKRCFNTFLFK